VAADGIAFAITRVNHGDFMDPEFDTNWAAIASVGLVRGAYQYFDPGGDPVAQANTFIGKVGTLGPGDLPGVIDVESTDGLGPGAIAANVATWVDLVEAGTGRKPMIYTGSYFWNDNVQTTDLNDHPLWIAHYTTGCPNMPTAWPDWVMWQYSSTGSVAGIAGDVDTDRFNGGVVGLHDLAANGLRAAVVSLDYPATLAAGASGTVELVLENLGARSWGASTFLGTTEPRDRASVFAASDWTSDHRVIAMSDPALSGATVTVTFTIVAPDEPGAYSEHFNLVEEGFAWFSDTPPGGGPDDDVIALDIEVTPDDGSGGSGLGGQGGGGGGTTTALQGIPNSGDSGSCALGLPGALRTSGHGWWALAWLLALRVRAARRASRSPRPAAPTRRR
jgi:lysozyme